MLKIAQLVFAKKGYFNPLVPELKDIIKKLSFLQFIAYTF